MHGTTHHGRRWALAGLLAGLLAACGGGAGGDDSESSGGDGGAGTGAGAVATVTSAAIPGYVDGESNALVIGASNRGLYVNHTKPDGTTSIDKLHGAAIFNDWSSAAFSYLLQDAAIANIYAEQDREVSFYWAGGPLGGKRWGLYTANTGTPALEIEDNMSISRVAAGGREGVITPQPWIVANGAGNINSDYQYLYQADGTASAGTFRTSDYFGTPADTDVIGNVGVLLSHPTDPRMFVAAGNTLRVYAPTALESTETLPVDGFMDSISDLVWYDGRLYIGAGNKVFRRDGPGSFQQVAESDFSRFGLPGAFCIKAGEILTTDGMATRISDGAKRNYIYRGELSAEQQAEGAILAASLSPGIYCSPDNTSATIYAAPSATQPGRVRMIDILQ